MERGDSAPIRWKDPLIWLSILLPSSIWLGMVFALSLKVAWISLACGGIIGFFLWLVALGYDDKQVAKATVIGIMLNAVLAFYSASVAF